MSKVPLCSLCLICAFALLLLTSCATTSVPIQLRMADPMVVDDREDARNIPSAEYSKVCGRATQRVYFG